MPPVWYYYQNPTSGAVSQNPLSVEQMVKLLVPVREGMKPILPGHTQCLAVRAKGTNESESGPESASTTHNFGTWASVATIDVLKEASCSQWHVAGATTTSGASEESKGAAATEGPYTCRKLLEIYKQTIPSSSSSSPSKVLVYAPSITQEWTPINQLANLLCVFDVLSPPPTPSAPATQYDEKSNHASTHQGGMDGSQEVQDELEAFLSATADAGTTAGGNRLPDEEADDHAYESDGGTRYVKDPLTGHWIHEALARESMIEDTTRGGPKGKQGHGPPKPSSSAVIPKASKTTKKSKKAKFSKRNARNWIYVTGLPSGSDSSVSIQEVHKYFVWYVRLSWQ